MIVFFTHKLENFTEKLFKKRLKKGLFKILINTQGRALQRVTVKCTYNQDSNLPPTKGKNPS